MAARAALSRSALVEQAQQLAGSGFDLRVVELRGSLPGRDEARPVDAPEVAEGKAVTLLRLLARLLVDAEVPLAIAVPAVPFAYVSPGCG